MNRTDLELLKITYNDFFEYKNMDDDDIQNLFSCYAMVLDGEMGLAEFEAETGVSIFDLPFTMRNTD